MVLEDPIATVAYPIRAILSNSTLSMTSLGKAKLLSRIGALQKLSKFGSDDPYSACQHLAHPGTVYPNITTQQSRESGSFARKSNVQSSKDVARYDWFPFELQGRLNLTWFLTRSTYQDPIPSAFVQSNVTPFRSKCLAPPGLDVRHLQTALNLVRAEETCGTHRRGAARWTLNAPFLEPRHRT
ncbi:uncharacterized protein BDV14DRAFT_164691 [Aspergillus stella-maris]|uniref:uncharacterized protein n=1 Tax=Aspergillus stella-maris TaxID=1810926 RepID=UPI003CCDE208